MKLTLGQASKEAGISKPSLSAAIKKGRLSAYKNDAGTYEIDPAELFRVYPRKANTNMEANTNTLPLTNPRKLTEKGDIGHVLGLLLVERDKLIVEKERAIERLEDEKDKIRDDLQDQKEQTKRMTQLLEHKSSGGGEWEKSLKALENRISNQERTAKETAEKEQKIIRQNRELKKALDEERNKSFFKKLFG